MGLVFRPITPSEVADYNHTAAMGFHETPERGDQFAHVSALELDRSIVAVDRDMFVATARTFGAELALPGGSTIPAAGVTAVTVRATHRRRGILRTMMERMLDDGADRGEPVALLTASEGGIYGRFGFGVATSGYAVRVDVRRTRFREGDPSGSVRFVDDEEIRAVAPKVHDRTWRARAGSIGRSPEWWLDEWLERDESSTRFHVVHRSRSTDDGYAVYGVKRNEGAFGARTVEVHEIVASAPSAAAALWRFVCSLDLVATVTAHDVPIDTPLPWLLEDPRTMTVTSRHDSLWLRPLDVSALLSSRAYLQDGTVTLEVRDGFRPHGRAAGRFVVEACDGKVRCEKVRARPDLVLDVADLGAIVLGGVRAGTLADAGRVMVRSAPALAAADALFAAEREPYALSWF